MKHAYVAPMVLALAACGGGAAGTTAASGTGAIGIPGTSPTTPPAFLIAGNVVELPADAYGPAAIAGVTYASADATQTVPLAHAVVIAGPVPITGATPPAQLPPNDVAVVTDAAGAFSASLAVAPAAASNAEPFVIPPNNALGFTAPPSGYYIEVFGATTDGRSAGAALPLHRFVSASGALALRVTTASAAEAGALAAVNADRAANAANPLIFDESAEEIARLHAADATARGTFICHYDANNAGPSSRYLAAGGIGLTGESVGIASAPDAATAFAFVESAFLNEKTAAPPGAHFTNLADPSHRWAGIAASGPGALAFNFNVDYELVTPSAQGSSAGASGYTAAGCPAGIVDNNS